MRPSEHAPEHVEPKADSTEGAGGGDGAPREMEVFTGKLRCPGSNRDERGSGHQPGKNSKENPTATGVNVAQLHSGHRR